MKKIMFNDKYRQTKAVLEGRKTQTRRVLHCPKTFGGKYVSGFRVCTNEQRLQFTYLVDEDECEIEGSVNILSAYKIGEEVAVAQCYGNCGTWFFPFAEYGYMAGYTNKMFVRAEEMPHRIKITNIRVERLQDISDEDCLKEGVIYTHARGDRDREDYCVPYIGNYYQKPHQAFAELIDKTCGKGTWDSNPWVFVYDFELIK